MKLSVEGLIELIGHEGIYIVRSSGTGDNPKLVLGKKQSALTTCANGHILPIKDAIDRFRIELEKFEFDVLQALTISVHQTEFDALVSFHYDTRGIRRAALVKSLNRGNRQKAAQQFANWQKNASDAQRRAKEKKLFEMGIYSNNRIVKFFYFDTNIYIDEIEFLLEEI